MKLTLGNALAGAGVFAAGYIASAALGPSDAGNADKLLKEALRSPASYSSASSDTVWTGKTDTGKKARIVKVTFDAQNGFGATIRDCQYVAFWYDGSKVFHFPNRHTWPCSGDSQEIAVTALVAANDFQKYRKGN